MRIFIDEFITGGGMYSIAPTEAPSGSLLREGAAMITALATDFASIPNVEVVAFHDERLEGIHLPDSVEAVVIDSAEREQQQLVHYAKASDWTIVIAPEFDDLLLRRARLVEQSGGRLLSPSSATIGGMQNKNTFLRQLEHHGIATPRGGRFRSGFPLPRRLPYPAVIKPLCGAGSTGIMMVDSPDVELDLPAGERFRIEEIRHGVPASVSVLCGPKGHVVLPACGQRINNDGSFQYLGGTAPLRGRLRDRAETLARFVTDAVLLSIGYIGIDMILAEDGRHDRAVVIEANPRLTTSYVGLRRLARCNLAQAMLDVAEGKKPDLSFSDGPVEFLADGTIVHG